MVISLSTIKNYSILISCALLLTACSVGMALDGQRDPDISVVKREVHRADIEAQLGAPIRVTSQPNGQTTAVYKCEVGNESSPGRAVAHGVMDVLTLGIWEIVGTPIERFKGDTITMVVTYDREERVVSAIKSQ